MPRVASPRLPRLSTIRRAPAAGPRRGAAVGAHNSPCSPACATTSNWVASVTRPASCWRAELTIKAKRHGSCHGHRSHDQPLVAEDHELTAEVNAAPEVDDADALASR